MELTHWPTSPEPMESQRRMREEATPPRKDQPVRLPLEYPDPKLGERTGIPLPEGRAEPTSPNRSDRCDWGQWGRYSSGFVPPHDERTDRR